MIDHVNNKALKRLRVWCVVGFLISLYATYVELRAEKDTNYVAMCDVSAKISCTAVFTTVYGRGFGILQQLLGYNPSWIPPNGVIGILYYGFLLVSSYWNNKGTNGLRFYLSILSNLLSFYLAFLLYFVLKNFCFVCVAIYFVNYNCLLHVWRLRKIKKGKNSVVLEETTNKEEIKKDA